MEAWPKLKLPQLIGYSSGNFGKAIVWNTLELFFIFYLTDILNIEPARAGLLILISLLWDAVLDPVVGLLADRTQTRFGKYGPYILIGAPLCAASYMSIFLVQEFAPAGSALTLAFISLLFFRTTYTLIDLPHNALLARVSYHSRERSLAAILRFSFSSLAVLVISVSSIFILAPDNLNQQANHFRNFSVAAAMLSVSAMWLSWRSVRNRDQNAPSPRTTFATQLSSLKYVFTSRNALILLWVAFITALCLPIFAKGLSYFAKYNLGEEQWAGYALTSMVIGQILSILAWLWMSKRMEKASTLGAAHGILIISMLLFSAFANSGQAAIYLLAGFVGIGAAGAYSIFWGMAPDVIDSIEAEYGIRLEALYFSLIILAMKFAIALGFGVFGGMLSIVGYVANAEQSQMALSGIHTIMWAMPILGSIAVCVALQWYSITHSSQSQDFNRLRAKSST